MSCVTVKWRAVVFVKREKWCHFEREKKKKLLIRQNLSSRDIFEKNTILLSFFFQIVCQTRLEVLLPRKRSFRVLDALEYNKVFCTRFSCELRVTKLFRVWQIIIICMHVFQPFKKQFFCLIKILIKKMIFGFSMVDQSYTWWMLFLSQGYAFFFLIIQAKLMRELLEFNYCERILKIKFWMHYIDKKNIFFKII